MHMFIMDSVRTDQCKITERRYFETDNWERQFTWHE